MFLKNILIDFWLGKVKLWKSFWLVGEIIYPITLFIIIFYLEMKFFNNSEVLLIKQNDNINLPVIDFTNLHLINKFFYLMATIFTTVGIWRSAEKSSGSFIWITLTLIYLSYFRIYGLRNLFY